MVIDRKKYMDLDEIRQLRTSARGWNAEDLQHGRQGGVVAWMLVDLALTTGLRVGEIEKLNIKDVDLKRSCLTVMRLKRKKKAKETLALGKDFVKHLQDYIAWTGRSKGPLFVSSRPAVDSRDGRITAQGLQRIWKTAVIRAGFKVKRKHEAAKTGKGKAKKPKSYWAAQYSIHAARHSIAVQLLKKTKNLRQVQKQLGHASPATTANMYADVSFEDMQNGVTNLYDDED